MSVRLGTDLVKVLVPDTRETLWAQPLGDLRYRLDNVPFYEPGMHVDDIVVCEWLGEQLVVSEVVEKGGHGTVRALFGSLVRDAPQRAFAREVDELGLWHEIVGGGLIVIDCPSSEAMGRITALLSAAEAGGLLEWQASESVAFARRCKEAVETDNFTLMHTPGPGSEAQDQLGVPIEDNSLSPHRWERLWAEPIEAGPLPPPERAVPSVRPRAWRRGGGPRGGGFVPHVQGQGRAFRSLHASRHRRGHRRRRASRG